MIVYPDLELRKGRLVNLLDGKMENPIVYDLDPVKCAKDLVAEGAEWLHVIDIDAVFNEGENTDIIKEIIRKAGCKVQVGGAIRNMEKVHMWMGAGASRVVIATAAVKYPHFVKAAATAYPEGVVVSIDAKGHKVVVEGWTETTRFTPVEFARQFENAGLAASFSHTTDLAKNAKIPVIASGLVKSIDDISTLSYLPGISGVITSRALFGGKFTFKEANAIASQREPIAPFI
jgi:phosphoribosylformimino-5-aminoimidazole carboxamide ribotide isomerase